MLIKISKGLLKDGKYLKKGTYIYTYIHKSTDYSRVGYCWL